MPANPVPPPTDPREADDQARAAVLEHLLALYPAWLTRDELGRAVGDAEAASRAVRDLVADGVLHHRDGFVLPTRAAVRCAAVLSDAPVRVTA